MNEAKYCSTAKRDAVAQVTLAEASARAIQKVAEAMGQEQAPLYYLLGERYIQSVTELAGSANAKIVMLPADIQDSLRGLLGRR